MMPFKYMLKATFYVKQMMNKNTSFLTTFHYQKWLIWLKKMRWCYFNLKGLTLNLLSRPKRKKVLPFSVKSNPKNSTYSTPAIYCTHGLECKIIYEKMSVRNLGRKYYACRKIKNRRRNFRCKTFVWQDAILGSPEELCYHEQACQL